MFKRLSLTALAAVAVIASAALSPAFAGHGGHGGGHFYGHQRFARFHFNHHHVHYHPRWHWHWRHGSYGGGYGYGGYDGGTVATPVSSCPSNCLGKEYRDDGSVIFFDRCTNESAIAGPVK
jgi:hypothetical protein